MTVLFRNLRVWGYVVVFLLSATVLAFSAYFATIFLPQIHREFTIYSLVVPSWTFVVFVPLLFWYSNPLLEICFLFITAVAWLAMGAWASDMFGPAECFALKGQKITTSKGSINASSYCYEAKIVEAFSWSLFGILIFFFLFVIALANRSQVLGRPDIWKEHINNLPWFGQYPGWPGLSISQYPSGQGAYGFPSAYAGPNYQPMPMMDENHVQQQHGHSIIIYPGVNGGRARIEQRPGIVHNV
ncbi:hypothetical protein FA95DRAFT_130317 [Auriscalpium vulgare]|uniref:Uncharacterized protein n=1 Tax=Auriscalpium vulgare TaxID=40419 RepID=A0ACB8RP63_9AGAM|nr:hypothetical protein FA95DRAFT_130317 [Auriscalpium vulgare]